MPRRKSYVDPNPVDASNEGDFERGIQIPKPDPDGALIDFRALAPDRRFTDSKYSTDLEPWLGEGIDAWVWACVAAIKSLLYSGKVEISTLIASGQALNILFEFLVVGRASPFVDAPAQLKPIHTAEFTAWLQAKVVGKQITQDTARQYYQSTKRVLIEMMELNFFIGQKSKLFPRGAVKRGNSTSRQISLSGAEQARLASAIKSDLSQVHKGTLDLMGSEIQALRFLLVSHRQGVNMTPLLEMDRNGMRPGVIPGTVQLFTGKFRGKSFRGRMGRAAVRRSKEDQDTRESIPFPMAEGAVIQQAIESTSRLAELAPAKLKDRIWLYQSSSPRDKDVVVTVLTPQTLGWCIQRVMDRHNLLADDGRPLRINSSRLRKSFFDRAWLRTNGSLPFTANLMGNSATVASTRYPSVTIQLQADAANFLKDEYIERLRGSTDEGTPKRVIPLVPVAKVEEGTDLEPTPISRCQDPLNGQHAPHNGSPCDRFVMCLFCSSFAIVGTDLDLWKLFSFQVFAKAELAYLDRKLGVERAEDDVIEDLRDRYRVAIPYITSFTDKQFPSAVVQAARRKTGEALHPFWQLQIANSERARTLGAD